LANCFDLRLGHQLVTTDIHEAINADRCRADRAEQNGPHEGSTCIKRVEQRLIFWRGLGRSVLRREWLRKSKEKAAKAEKEEASFANQVFFHDFF